MHQKEMKRRLLAIILNCVTRTIRLSLKIERKRIHWIYQFFATVAIRNNTLRFVIVQIFDSQMIFYQVVN